MNRDEESSNLYDSKMELHPDEGSFVSPAMINLVSDKPKCSLGKAAKVILGIVLIAGAFVSGYLIRRALEKDICSTGKQNASDNEGDLRFLQKILDEMSPENIERKLRFVTLSCTFWTRLV